MLGKRLSPAEVRELPIGTRLAFDCETYPNMFLVMFKVFGSDDYISLECDETSSVDAKLLWNVLVRFKLYSFNGIRFDVPIVTAALKGFNSTQLAGCANAIIAGDLNPWAFCKAYDVKIPELNHVDISEVLPLEGSLKMRAAQINFDNIWELPFDPANVLADWQKEQVRKYCQNDVRVTERLVEELAPELDLREHMSAEYGVDLRSKSDAQIAEAIIAKRIEAKTGIRPKRPESMPTEVRYDAPSWVKFHSPALTTMLARLVSEPFAIAPSGAVEAPSFLKSATVNVCGLTLRMGIGGLHSCEKCVAYRSGNGFQLIDRDVASYYPSIIVNQELFPPHLGRNFLDVYRQVLEERLEAKALKLINKAQTLKIVANGSFGKLSSKYSILYAPKLFLQVTITGQLALLMLIEKAMRSGIEVVSANTDGVVFNVHDANRAQLTKIITWWESVTNFKTEETLYDGYFARDVNNYIAIKPGSKIKCKGAYSNPWNEDKSIFRFHKSPTALIVTDAIQALLCGGVPIENTVRSCSDITKFAIVRRVDGGGIKNGLPTGKVCRWYISTNSPGPIRYVRTDNLVPDSEGAVCIRKLPGTLPEGIDYDWYIEKAKSALSDLGLNKPKQIRLKYGLR